MNWLIYLLTDWLIIKHTKFVGLTYHIAVVMTSIDWFDWLIDWHIDARKQTEKCEKVPSTGCLADTRVLKLTKDPSRWTSSSRRRVRCRSMRVECRTPSTIRKWLAAANLCPRTTWNVKKLSESCFLYTRKEHNTETPKKCLIRAIAMQSLQ